MTSKHRLTKLFALSLTVVALAIPSVASAYPVGPTLGSYHAPPVDPAAPAPAVVSATDPGFSWEDAVVGGCIALAVLAIGAGCVLVIKAVRADRTSFRLTN